MNPIYLGGQSIYFSILLAILKMPPPWLVSCQVMTAPLYLPLSLESKTSFCLAATGHLRLVSILQLLESHYACAERHDPAGQQDTWVAHVTAHTGHS